MCAQRGTSSRCVTWLGGVPRGDESIEREGALAKTLVDAARTTLEAGPWRRINAGPNWKSIESLARRWPLRGADLWHLATAKELHAGIPELAFLSFDRRLNAAAHGEGLIRESIS
jgi:hypothetical protein